VCNCGIYVVGYGAHTGRINELPKNAWNKFQGACLHQPLDKGDTTSNVPTVFVTNTNFMVTLLHCRGINQKKSDFHHQVNSRNVPCGFASNKLQSRVPFLPTTRQQKEVQCRKKRSINQLQQNSHTGNLLRFPRTCQLFCWLIDQDTFNASWQLSWERFAEAFALTIDRLFSLSAVEVCWQICKITLLLLFQKDK